MARNLIREMLFRRRGPFGASIYSQQWPLVCSNLRDIRRCHINFTSGLSTTKTTSKLSQDRIEMFMEPEIQKLLKQLTEKDFQRVFRKRKVGQKLREPKYTFMTEEQLKQALEEADQKAEKLLQMPPVLRPRKAIEKILSFDPEIQGVEKSTIVFTDITMNVSDRDRLMVARDPDGTLRYASWDEREKMNLIFYPRDGKEFVVPRMLADSDSLKSILNRGSEEDNTYEFVLDRACLQFEPDDPKFISICETTYNAIDHKQHYDCLKSTRQYGPFVFYLVRMRQMDNLLIHSIQHERISSDALTLVSLFHILFPESKSKSVAQGLKKDVDKIRAYIELDAIKRSELELSLNAVEELQRKREEFTSELEQSHGVQKN